MSSPTEIFDDLCSRYIINEPQEELVSFERILFLIEQAHWFYEDFYRSELGLPKYTLERFVELMFHHCPPLQPFASGVKAIFKDFRQYKSTVPVCGCILLNPDLTKCLLVQGYGSGTWSFPRGKINKDEPMSSCAIREVYEETGYDATPNLLLDDFIDFRNGKQSVRLYLCPEVAEDTAFETRTRKEIRNIAWFKIQQLPMSYEAKKQPGAKFFNVPPVLVSQLRSWIKKRKRKKGKKKKKVVANSNKASSGMSDPNFPTDSEISGKQFAERDLVPWEPSDDDSDVYEPLKSSGSGQEWDQWAANREKFGYVSDYNPEDYTTKLDESKAEYAERLLQAYGMKTRKKKANGGGSGGGGKKNGGKSSSTTPKKLLQREQAAPEEKSSSSVKSAALSAFDDL